jgi:hypothetical protein
MHDVSYDGDGRLLGVSIENIVVAKAVHDIVRVDRLDHDKVREGASEVDDRSRSG